MQNYTWQNLPQLLRLQRDSSLSPKKRPEKLGFVAFYVLNVCPLRGMRGMFVGCCGMPTQISASYTLVTVQNSATHSHKHIVMHNICVCWCCFRGANTEFTWITHTRGVTLFGSVGNICLPQSCPSSVLQQSYSNLPILNIQFIALSGNFIVFFKMLLL